jgi:hypothetical protein
MSDSEPRDPNTDLAGLQKVGGLGKSIEILMMVAIPLNLLTGILSFGLREKARDLLDGDIGDREFRNSLGLTTAIGLIVALTTLAVFVLTIVWMFRLAKNQQTLGRTGTWTPAWAIGGWFLPPCVLYVIPYLMMRDLWKSSDPESGPEWRKNAVAPIVNIWWALYGLLPILFVTVTFSGTNLRSRSMLDAAQRLVDTFAISTLSTVVQIAAGVAYLMLVMQLTRRHMQLIGEA